MTTKRRPTVEEISVDRAIELLGMHKHGKLSVKPIVSVVRDPSNPDNILSLSISEKDAFVR